MNERKVQFTITYLFKVSDLKFAAIVSLILLISCQINGQKLIPYLSHGKYGYADLQGLIRIEPVYDEAEFFDNFQVAAVRLDTQWFMINTAGIRLVPLKSKYYQYQLHQALSSHGAFSYGSRKNIDTVSHLLRLELYTLRDRRYINVRSGVASPVFSNFSRFHSDVGMLTGFEGILTHGLYIGQTGEKEYKVMNAEAEIIASSNARPFLLNDSLLTYRRDDISVILNFKSNTSFTLPFLRTTGCIAGANFIVTNIQESRDNPFRSKISLQAGVVDRSGSILIQPQYDDLNPFGSNLLLAKRNDAYFLITLENKRIDSMSYLHVYEMEDIYYQAQLPNQKWTLLNSAGSKVIDQEFDKIDFNINCQCYLVTSGGISSILTSNLDTEISYRADAIYETEKIGYFTFDINEKSGLLAQDGKEIIPPLYEHCSPDRNSDFVIIEENKLKGLMALSGQLLMEPQFEDLQIHMFNQQPYLLVKKNGKYAYFDSALIQLSDYQPRLHYLYSNPIYWDRLENDSFQLYTRFGQPLGFKVKSFSDDYAMPDSTYLMLVNKSDTSFLLYEAENKITIDTFYSAETHSFNLESGLIGVKVKDQEGVRHFRGQWIVPLAEHRVIYISAYLIVCKTGDQYCFYDTNGRKVNNISSSQLKPQPYMSVWRFEKMGKVGFISAYTGKTIVPPQYDEGYFHASFSIIVNIIQENGRNITLVFDTLGNKLLKTGFDELYPIQFRDTVFYYQAKKDGKCGLIDEHGRECIPIDYRSVYTLADTTFFQVWKEDKSRLIYNTDWQVAFSDTTLPTRHEYIELPHHRYLFYYNDHSIIVDYLGRTLKRINSAEVSLAEKRYKERQFLEVKENGQVYLIDPDSLISFRDETQQ